MEALEAAAATAAANHAAQQRVMEGHLSTARSEASSHQQLLHHAQHAASAAIEAHKALSVEHEALQQALHTARHQHEVALISTVPTANTTTTMMYSLAMLTTGGHAARRSTAV